ncbi:uncharacterized protein LOC129744491 [Uranotaenia lowii]|uniref:uncharacterized protein LOC129744491 n=1 Tax=Uranotaenia lowii TaxID=190385 RepID=UPI00247ACC8D|nr:uncharacterized protein LOC129744491 [Uranotaenia lowii]
MVRLVYRSATFLVFVTLAVANEVFICRQVDGGSDCRNYNDEDLARTNFSETPSVVIRNGTIDDIERLLNGSLYHVPRFYITNLVAVEGSQSLERFPIEPKRFSVLHLTNSGIQQLEITGPDDSLISLDVKQNRLTTLGNIKFLASLEYLNADQNAIESISLDDFKDLHQLTRLSLRSNQIKSITATRPIILPYLKALDISDNQLTDLNVTFWEFQILETFNLNDNSLTRVSGGLRERFPEITTFSVGGRNNWDCQWIDDFLSSRKDRSWDLLVTGDRPDCPNQTRIARMICCHDSKNRS